MTSWLDALAFALPSVIVAAWLPLLIIAYYFLRLQLRQRALAARITELHLEPDYLRIYDFASWDKLCNAPRSPKDTQAIHDAFESSFKSQFGSGNWLVNFFLPFLLTLLSTILFALIVYRSLAATTSAVPYVQNGVLPLAIAGALLYISPLYIARYAGLALTPHTLLELLLRMWLAVILGVLLTTPLISSLQPAAAFLGGLLPVAAYDWLRDKVLPEKEKQEQTDEAIRLRELLQVVHLDEDLLDQFQHIGVRSLLELAYENPLRLFVETDLNLVVCIDLVDQANLCLYVPDAEIRRALNQYGIRTAIDFMTQSRERFDGATEARFLRPDEPLPDHLKEPFANMAKAMKLENVQALRNIIQMMEDNPQLEYIRQLWDMVNREVDQSTVPAPANPARPDPAAAPVPVAATNPT